MKPHLLEEEMIGLPLVRAFFEPKEVGKIVKKIIAGTPKEEMGSFIYYQGKENFRNVFMKQEKIPSSNRFSANLRPQDFVLVRRAVGPTACQTWNTSREQRQPCMTRSTTTPTHTIR